MRQEEFGLRRIILSKMSKHGLWGARHTSTEKVLRFFRPHLKGAARREIKQLVREGLVITKPTGYGLQISLNPQAKSQIERELDLQVSNFET